MQVVATRCGQYTTIRRRALHLLQVSGQNENRVLFPLPTKRHASSSRPSPSPSPSPSSVDTSKPTLVKPFLDPDMLQSLQKKRVQKGESPVQASRALAVRDFRSKGSSRTRRGQQQQQQQQQYKPLQEDLDTLAMTQQSTFSTTTSTILRRTARDLGYVIMPDGFVRVSDILRHDFYRDYDFRKFADACENDIMDSFELALLPDYVDGGAKEVWWVRARRGHTIPGVDYRTHRVLNMGRFPSAAYICSPDRWDDIREHGIAQTSQCIIPLYRNIKGKLFRNNLRILRHAEILCITIDTEKAANLGVKFFVTSDLRYYAVGNRDGVIPLDAFHNVVKLDLKLTDLAPHPDTGFSKGKG
ncbi:hypothetical protein D9613_006757 [Agrocybe pediades]|uniref:Uncharacterized protein n=1 Tax=Agrocybe pediades TaxID=84607 RepID=A0A8H4QHA8_9AGAR|nr:hypothetical protein D9613_006757 [Agrocybe pediades]